MSEATIAFIVIGSLGVAALLLFVYAYWVAPAISQWAARRRARRAYVRLSVAMLALGSALADALIPAVESFTQAMKSLELLVPAPDLSPDERAEVERFGIHDEDTR